MNRETTWPMKWEGYCPICEQQVIFRALNERFRASVKCPSCEKSSVPRERAIALVLKRLVPKWKRKTIHESSPANRGFSLVLSKQCKKYIASQFYPDHATGTIVNGFRNENLEKQSFQSETIDIALSLDVFEHINEPEAAFRETARTLVKGGYCMFTVPTFITLETSQRCARIRPDGREEILVGKARYHGNPVDDKGALVTFNYGYDLPDLIYKWSGMQVEVIRFHDWYHGIIGPQTELYVCQKR